MGKYRETTFKKYLAEALSKDFSNSKTMFDQAVKNFKEVKEVNATSLNLLSDILRYISKFIEEQNVVNPLPELKKAKEAAREAMNQLDKAYEKMANLATAAAVQKNGRRYKINTPIIKMTKSQIIKTGTKLGVDYSLTHSCYNPDKNGRACGRCDSCQLRLKGFADAKLKDPVEYAKR